MEKEQREDSAIPVCTQCKREIHGQIHFDRGERPFCDDCYQESVARKKAQQGQGVGQAKLLKRIWRAHPIYSCLFIVLAVTTIFGSILSNEARRDPYTFDKSSFERKVKARRAERAGRTSGNTRPATSSTKQWFQGGNLHNATYAQWKSASRENKLATAADWLAGTDWKGHLNSPDDFNRIKVKAQMLVDAVDNVVTDKVVTVELSDSLRVAEVAAVIVTLSNDLDP